jgi:uncharacterized protein
MAKNSFDELEDFLLKLGRENDDVMLMDELDGFLAGVIVCPEMIMPSRWMPQIWSREGLAEDAPVFDDLTQANRILGLIQAHYNTVATSLLPAGGPYLPLYSYDPVTEEEIWELWAAGFGRALGMSPNAWHAIPLSGDEDATAALSGLRSLVAIDSRTSSLPKAEQKRLTKEAPDLIPEWVETLSYWRLAHHRIAPVSRQTAFGKTGRNDPCPCGSGRKYKKCHGAD